MGRKSKLVILPRHKCKTQQSSHEFQLILFFNQTFVFMFSQQLNYYYMTYVYVCERAIENFHTTAKLHILYILMRWSGHTQ